MGRPKQRKNLIRRSAPRAYLSPANVAKAGRRMQDYLTFFR
jgi:hypothetical protein